MDLTRDRTRGAACRRHDGLARLRDHGDRHAAARSHATSASMPSQLRAIERTFDLDLRTMTVWRTRTGRRHRSDRRQLHQPDEPAGAARQSAAGSADIMRWSGRCRASTSTAIRCRTSTARGSTSSGLSLGGTHAGTARECDANPERVRLPERAGRRRRKSHSCIRIRSDRLSRRASRRRASSRPYDALRAVLPQRADGRGRGRPDQLHRRRRRGAAGAAQPGGH